MASAETSFDSIHFPARWIFSKKYRSLFPKDLKRFLILLSFIHMQGGVLVALHEPRIEMRLGTQAFLLFMKKMVDGEFLKETDIGYEPHDIEFHTSAHVRIRVRRRIKALRMEKLTKDSKVQRMNAYSHLPVVRRSAYRLIDFLNRISGVSYIKELHERPTSAILVIENKLKSGEMTVTSYKQKIVEIYQSATSEEDRASKLRPSQVF
jgi:hypothetical protein